MNRERTGTGSAAAWLAGRAGEAPESLRESVEDAVRRAGARDPDGGISDGLITAAVECLGKTLDTGRDRAAAAPLLAADALLTWAVEHAAEDGRPLEELAKDVNGRLETLIGE